MGRPIRPRIRITDSGCWEWLGSRKALGYGVVRINNREVYVHRLMYFLHNGAISRKKELDHLCRNPRCCNPVHLEAVTHQENCKRGQSADAIYRRMRVRNTCPKGHPYYGKNLYRYPDGKRACRICRKDVLERWEERHGRHR